MSDLHRREAYKAASALQVGDGVKLPNLVRVKLSESPRRIGEAICLAFKIGQRDYVVFVAPDDQIQIS